MNHRLPDIKIFKYVEQGDFFFESEDYQYISDRLGLREWNSVVWIGRLFCMDNDYGEHWFDNWDLKDEKEMLAKQLGYEHEKILVIDSTRFKDGKDGPCNTDEFRKLFWTDVLKSLELNLATLFEKAREVNEINKQRKYLKEFIIEDLEDRIMELIKDYAPDNPLIKEKALSKIGLDEKIVEEIADHLDTGMICYVHKETKEIKSIVDTQSWLDIDLEAWEEDIEEIEENFDNYWKVESMSSNEAYRIMEQYADQVENEQLKNKLNEALNRRKPFQNFKFVIDNSGEYREKWFKFKKKKYEQYVIKELEQYFLEE